MLQAIHRLCLQYLSAEILMLTRFMVGCCVVQMGSSISEVQSATLSLRSFAVTLHRKAFGGSRHPRPEDAFMAASVFKIMALSFSSQEIWFGRILHKARNFNVVRGVTLPPEL